MEKIILSKYLLLYNLGNICDNNISYDKQNIIFCLIIFRF